MTGETRAAANGLKPQPRPNLARIKPYVPGKPIEEVERELGIKDVIKLASNENPLGASPEGLVALNQAVERIYLYPDGYCFQLRRALCEFWGLGGDNLAIGNGSDEIIKLIAEAFLPEAGEAIIPWPSFSEYEFATQLVGATSIYAPLQEFRHDLTGMAFLINEHTRLVFVCNPNNPTGTIVRRREVEEFLATVPTQVVVVFDEAYAEYVTDPEYTSGLEYIRQGYPNVLVLRTFSKIYGLAGLRVGYAIGAPELISWINRAREPFNVNSLAQVAATAALRDEEHLFRSRELNERGKEYLYGQFDDMGLKYIPTQANFIFVDLGKDSRTVFQELLKQGVIIRTGDIFGLPTFVRVTVGTQSQNDRFVRALRKVF